MRLNTTLLQQSNLRKTETSLTRLARGIAFELVVNAFGVALIGAFIAANLHEPRFLVPAIVLDLYAIALVIAGARQLVALREHRLRRAGRRDSDSAGTAAAAAYPDDARHAAFRSTDVGSADYRWLAWALRRRHLCRRLGLACGERAVRRFGHTDRDRSSRGFFGPRLASSTPMRALADAIAGHSLRAAIDSLDSIRRFEEC